MSDTGANDGDSRISRYALVTVGASASFKPLIEEVISDAFIAKLKSLRFTTLFIQCGPDYDYYESVRVSRGLNDNVDEFSVVGFPYKKSLQLFLDLTTPSTTGDTSKRARGVVITHAGSGSILDALDHDTTIIAVPNPALMDNHQSEIADEMEKQGFLTQAKLGSLADHLTEELLDAPKKQWPPDPDPDSAWPGGFWDVVDALMPRRSLSTAQKDSVCVCL